MWEYHIGENKINFEHFGSFTWISQIRHVFSTNIWIRESYWVDSRPCEFCRLRPRFYGSYIQSFQWVCCTKEPCETDSWVHRNRKWHVLEIALDPWSLSSFGVHFLHSTHAKVGPSCGCNSRTSKLHPCLALIRCRKQIISNKISVNW